MTAGRHAWLALAAAAVLVAALNLLATLAAGHGRLDLTERGLYSLAPGTERLLASVDQPLTFDLYLSQRLAARSPAYDAYGDRLRQLLDAMAEASGGRIAVRVIAPEPFSEAEDRAMAAGLQGVALDGGTAWFGLIASNDTDGREVIPFFDLAREPFVEYDLARAVDRLIHPRRPRIGVISGLPLFGRSGQDPRARELWVIADQVRRQFDVQVLSPDLSEIPPGLDALWVIHPPDLAPAARDAIGAFVEGGGRALIQVDPLAERPALAGQDDWASNLPDLFARWGVAFDPGQVVADPETARPVTPGRAGAGAVPYLPWLALGPDQLARDHVATGDLARVNVASAGALTRRDDATTRLEPLIVVAGGTVPADRARTETAPDGLVDDFVPADAPQVLAARVVGPVGAGRIDIVVLADTDILEDAFWVRAGEVGGRPVAVPAADNGALILNLLERLTGSVALAELRGRAVADRPFTLIREMERDAARRWRDRERELEARLAGLEERLAEARAPSGQAGVILTADQRDAIADYRAELVGVRAELREVQAALRQEITALHGWLVFFNTAAVPLLVALATVALLIVRRRRGRMS